LSKILDPYDGDVKREICNLFRRINFFIEHYSKCFVAVNLTLP